MNIEPFHLLIWCLATWEIIEIWRHGSIFAGLRARVELYDSMLATLLLCGFCLSPWVAAAVIASWATDWWIPRFVITAFAVARLANIGNDLAHDWCRTPRNGGPNSKNTFEE